MSHTPPVKEKLVVTRAAKIIFASAVVVVILTIAAFSGNNGSKVSSSGYSVSCQNTALSTVLNTKPSELNYYISSAKQDYGANSRTYHAIHDAGWYVINSWQTGTNVSESTLAAKIAWDCH